MSNAILKAENLSIAFGGLRAVNDVSLAVESGSVTSLIGPNGAGKTTVFNMVTGIYQPTIGRVLFDSRDAARPQVNITNMPGHKVCRHGIARTFQNIRLFTDMPVLDNVKVGLHGRTSSSVLGAIGTLPGTVREEVEVEAAVNSSMDRNQVNPIACVDGMSSKPGGWGLPLTGERGAVRILSLRKLTSAAG